MITVYTQRMLSLWLRGYLRRWWWVGVPMVGWMFTDLDHAGSPLRALMVLWTGTAGGRIYSHDAARGATFVHLAAQGQYRAYLWFSWAIYALTWPLIAVALLLLARPSLLQARNADYLAWCSMLFAASASFLAMTEVASHRVRTYFAGIVRVTFCVALVLLFLTLWYGFEITLAGALLFSDIRAAAIMAMFALLVSAWVFMGASREK